MPVPLVIPHGRITVYEMYSVTMTEKNLHLLALSEVRLPRHGTLRIGSNVIAYSGSATDDPHHRRCGVAVVMGERAASA